MKTMVAQEKKNVLGQRGEEIAGVYLKKRGYRILDRNWSVRGRNGKMLGELDIVAKKGMDIVFVEVKAGSSEHPAWRPEIHVTPWKMERLRRAARAWLSAHKQWSAPWQIVVIAVDFSTDPPKLRHIPYAVSF